MRTLTVIWILLAAAGATAEDKAREVVKRAITAHGGETAVGKLRTMRLNAEGTMTLVPGQPAIAFKIEDVWQMPDRYRTSSSFKFMDKDITQTQVIDGESGWSQVNGRTEDMPKEAIAEMRAQKHAEGQDRLVFLSDKSFDLTALDDAKVNGQPAAAVLITKKGRRDVKLYFDKATGLLVKREHDVQDPATGALVAQEAVFGDFREKDGVQHWTTITVFRAGNKMIEAKVKEIEFLEKVDAKLFLKPER